MNRRTIIILSAVFLALLSVLFLGRRLRNRSVKPAFEKLEITELAITEKGKETVKLKKDGEDWYSGKWPADAEKINRVVDALKKIALEDVISTRKEKYAEFEVSESSAVTVNIGKELKLYIGKRGSDWRTSFIRVEGDPAVYIVESVNKRMFTGDEKDWRNKDIVTYKKSDIKDIEMEYDGKKYIVNKGTGTWADIAHEMKYLKAVEFIEDSAGFKEEFNRPYLKIDIDITEGRHASYTVIKRDKKYYIKPSGYEIVYEIKSKNIENIIKIIREKLTAIE